MAAAAQPSIVATNLVFIDDAYLATVVDELLRSNSQQMAAIFKPMCNESRIQVVCALLMRCGADTPAGAEARQLFPGVEVHALWNPPEVCANAAWFAARLDAPGLRQRVYEIRAAIARVHRQPLLLEYARFHRIACCYAHTLVVCVYSPLQQQFDELCRDMLLTVADVVAQFIRAGHANGNLVEAHHELAAAVLHVPLLMCQTTLRCADGEAPIQVDRQRLELLINILADTMSTLHYNMELLPSLRHLRATLQRHAECLRTQKYLFTHLQMPLRLPSYEAPLSPKEAVASFDIQPAQRVHPPVAAPAALSARPGTADDMQAMDGGFPCMPAATAEAAAGAADDPVRYIQALLREIAPTVRR